MQRRRICARVLNATMQRRRIRARVLNATMQSRCIRTCILRHRAVQILRAYVDASSLDEVRLNMGAAAKDIAALVPELLDSSHSTHQTPGAMADSSPARFRTFDAIRQFLH